MGQLGPHCGVLYISIIERKKSIYSLPPPCEVSIVVPLASLRSEPSTLGLISTSEPYEGRTRPCLVTNGSCPPHHLAQGQGRSCNSVDVSPVNVFIIVYGSLSCGGVGDWCPVCPPLPDPHTVDGKVTGDQRAPGGLLGYGVGHGWGHHPAAGL